MLTRDDLQHNEQYFEPTMAFKRNHCNEPVPLNDLGALTSLTNLFDALFPTTFNSQEDISSNALARRFIFCLIWTVGGAVDSDGRKLLDQHLRDIDPEILPSGNIYDYYVDPNTNRFQLWDRRIPHILSPMGASYHDIVVPTVEVIRNSFIVESLCNENYRVLISGACGTGKTLLAQSYLKGQSSKSCRHISINLSLSTTSRSLQNIIHTSLEKSSKGVVGPPFGAKKFIVFIDDLNMPKKTSEESPFQPPLELLRQFIDYGGWYNMSKCSWENVIDTHLVCAMSHPTAGRELISSRTQSRFTVLNCTGYDTKETALIFHGILQNKLLCIAEKVTELFSHFSTATVDLFNEVRSTFLPVPGKSHYMFDLRDVLRVAYGMCLIAGTNESEGGLVNLWVHECLRTFCDRLVHEDDKKFWKLLTIVKTKYFSAVQCANVPIIGSEYQCLPTYAHVTLDDTNSNISSCASYQMVKDMPLLHNYMTQCLEDYNNAGNFMSMNLVLFQDVISHICRVQRIMHLDRGHMIFVGVGGSGRESLTRLSAFITGFVFFQVKASQQYRRQDFLEDIKCLLMRCGVENERTLFYIKDADIKEEIFLQDISSILVSGTLNSAFVKEEVIAICDSVRNDALADHVEDTEEMLWLYFVERTRKNLRVVIALSSEGSTLSSRIKAYPALLKCATVNWFNPWPKSALEQIAQKQIAHSSEELKESANIPNCMAKMHIIAGIKSNEMTYALKRYNYVTPSNFLNLLKTFEKFYHLKESELTAQKEKLTTGLHKLQAGRDQVSSMRIQLGRKQKVVENSKANCEIMMNQILEKKQKTEQSKKAIGNESKKIAEEEKKCLEIAAEAEADLAVALPALQNALDQVEKLDKSSITELKAYANPPPAVEQVLSCVMILLDKPTGWVNAKKIMGQTNFLSNLKSYNKDDVNDKTLNKVSKFVSLPSFASEEIEKVSKAAGALCAWCHAIYMYAGVAKEVAPKRTRLKAAESSLAQKQLDLKRATDALSAAASKLLDLKEHYDNSVAERDTLTQEAKNLQEKLERAEKLVNGLSSEYSRWETSINELEGRTKTLLGDVLLSSALLSYGGPFDTTFRKELQMEWAAHLKNEGIISSPDYSLEKCLGDCNEIQMWNVNGLPKDSFSTDNALMINNSNRWPLIIDPQGQANKWVKASMGDALKVLDTKKKEYLRELESAISFGLPVLIQNVSEKLDSNLEHILSKSLIKRGHRKVLKFSGKEIDFNENFSLFITTKLSNPHFLPEILAKTTLINFAVTRLGLEEQLLASIVTAEAPALETQKCEVSTQLLNGRRRLIELEDYILRLLVDSTGNLIDDTDLMLALQESKDTAATVKSQVLMAEETATKINQARNVYRSAAKRASTIFFSLSDMSAIDSMYQFSLDTYMADFIVNIEKSREIGVEQMSTFAKTRVHNITNHHTVEVFKTTSIALFEKDKLLFAFHLCCSILLEKGSFPELDFICYGANSSTLKTDTNSPDFSWLDENSNNALVAVDAVIGGRLIAEIFQNEEEWKEWHRSDKPESIELPGNFGTQISDIHKLCIIRGLRLDRMVQAVIILIEKRLGREFTESHSFDLQEAYNKSMPHKPLLIILSPGCDPVHQISKLAKIHNKGLVKVALGQGQGLNAIKAIEKASEFGGWVFLANCHLMPNWMADLEMIIDVLGTKTIHNSFRLWLSSKPNSSFPLTILQRSIKISTELPKGLSSNIEQACNLVSFEEFDHNAVKPGYKKLFFCLAWIHSVLIERRKFKSQGFNVQYDFNESDFTICHDILASFLGSDKVKIPFEALQYLIGEANYGGKVTDEWDRRLLNVYVKSFFCEEAVESSNYSLSDCKEYFVPKSSDLKSYKDYAKSLNPDDDPAAFGQHPNAEMSSLVEDAKRLLNCISMIRHDKQHAGQNGTGNNKASSIISKLEPVPKSLDPETVTTYEKHSQDPNALKTFLTQEILQYDNLLSIIYNTKEDLEAALEGQIYMDDELRCTLETLAEFKVPKQWQHFYNSCKTLDSWIEDLCKRIEQIESWMQNDAPNVFWLGGFIYPSGLLTAVMQIEARKKGLPIDTFGWNFEIIETLDIDSLDPPDEGIYVSGLFLEGARYDIGADCLSEPMPMELIHKMPVIHFHPTEVAKKPDDKIFVCPLYTCPDRAGPIQSPSFILPLHLRTGSKSSDHWVKRGVAMLLSTAE